MELGKKLPNLGETGLRPSERIRLKLEFEQ